MNGPVTLVAGAGYLGKALGDRLHASGGAVVALTHSQDSADALGATVPYPVLACDIGDPASLATARAEAASLVAAPVRSVVHCASSGRGGADAYRHVFLRGCRNLVDAFPGARVVFTSSTSVYPQTGGGPVDETSDAGPDRETGRVLREAEDIALAAGGVVVRLGGLFGPGRSVVLKRFLEGAATIDGDAGGRRGRTLNQIHRDDAVAAIVLLSGSDRTAGKIFNVCDDTPMAQRDCYEALSKIFERPLPPVRPPDRDRKRGWTDKRVSNRKLRALGWAPRFPSYLDAIRDDPDLVPSVLRQLGPGRESGID